MPESDNSKQERPRQVMFQVGGRPADTVPLVAAWLLPSISDLIFIVLFFALTYGALAPAMLGDGDIGWHIRNGETILATRAIPHVDSFSASMAGRPWFAWEWLYDAIIALVHRVAGLNGVVALSAFVIALTFSLVFRFSVNNGGTIGSALLFLALSLVASSIHFLARPHLVGWLFTVIWFWILDRSAKSTLAQGRADPTPIFLPVLMMAWVNLHGSFVAGFVLLAIYFLSDMVTAYRAASEEARAGALAHARMIAAVSILSALTSLLNPYGYKLHVHVYQYLSNPFLMRHIEEFRRPDFHSVPAQFFLSVLAVTGIAVVIARARLRWSEWFIIAFSAFLGLWAARNLPTSSMLLTMVGAPILSREISKPTSQRWLQFKFSQRRLGFLEANLRGHLWPLVFVICTMVICLNQGKVFGRQAVNAQFSPKRFPVQAVDFLAHHGYREPIFSLDSYGGYLIYRLYPDEKVWIDDRHDFYGEEYLTKYLRFLHADTGWQTVLDNYGIDLVLMPTKSKISDALRQQAGWKTTYADDTATVFERSRR